MTKVKKVELGIRSAQPGWLGCSLMAQSGLLRSCGAYCLYNVTGWNKVVPGMISSEAAL